MPNTPSQPRPEAALPSDAATGDSPAGDETFVRRGFLMRCLTATIAGLVALVPAGIGLFSFLDPLRRREGNDDSSAEGETESRGRLVRVTKLDLLPTDGTPQFFQVVADRRDAWTHHRNEPVGSVFLRRTPEGVRAFNATCPHKACFVNFVAERGAFRCPCHDSFFSIEGERSAGSPSARDLDELAVETRDGDVWVWYQNFRTGTAERIPLA